MPPHHHSFGVDWLPAEETIQAQRVVQAAPKARKASRRRLVSMVCNESLRTLGVMRSFRLPWVVARDGLPSLPRSQGGV